MSIGLFIISTFFNLLSQFDVEESELNLNFQILYVGISKASSKLLSVPYVSLVSVIILAKTILCKR